MDSRLWVKIFNYIPMTKSHIIKLFNMTKIDSVGSVEVYQGCLECLLHTKSKLKKICQKQHQCQCPITKIYIYKFIELNYDQPMNWIREVGIFNYIGQRHIIRPSNTYITKDKSCIYYSMPTYYKLPTMLNIDDEFIEKFIHDIGSAIVYLHSKNIIHRDITLDNLYTTNKTTDSEFKFILADFDKSKKIIATRPTLQSKYNYSCVHSDMNKYIQSPPEMLAKDGDCTVKVDVWFFGCILLYLLCKRHLCDVIIDYNSCHKFTDKTSLIDVYAVAVADDNLLTTIVKNVLQNTSNKMKSMDLYTMIVILSLKSNPNDRLSSKAISIAFDIPYKLVYYEPYHIWKRRMNDMINVKKSGYIIDFKQEGFMYIIKDLNQFKIQHIMTKNIELKKDSISENIDMLWDTFENKPKTKHLHNLTVVLFVNFAHRTTVITNDNIWMYITSCKFIIENLYMKVSLTKFIDINQESFTNSKLSSAITFILEVLRFRVINDLRW